MTSLNTYRSLFPSLANRVQLSSCSQSALALPVQQGLEAYTQSLLEQGMDWGGWMDVLQDAKAEFARLINADVDEIAVCASVTEAAASIATALDFSTPRNRIVLADSDFPSVGHLWLAQHRHGAEIDFIQPAGEFLDSTDYERSIDEKTLLVSVSQVAYYNGLRQDITAITQHAHRHGALVFVDAYQAAGSEPIDVKASGIDMLASGMQKYLLGIPGIAFLYVRKDLADTLEPTSTGWFGRQNPFAFDIRKLDYSAGAARFEIGTPPIAAAYAAQAALKLINRVGVDRIHSQQRELSTVALATAHACGLEVASPLDLHRKAANTAIRITDATLMEKRMAAAGYVVSARNDVIRVAPHFYNTAREVQDAINLLAELHRQDNASH